MALLQPTRLVGAPPVAAAGRPAPHDATDAAPRVDGAPVRTSLRALQDTQRRISEELRHGTLEAGAARIALEHLRRAALLLAPAGAAGAAPAEAAEVTICWLCSEAIVPDRLADPTDVFKHMSVCSGRRSDRRGVHGKPEKKWRSRG